MPGLVVLICRIVSAMVVYRASSNGDIYHSVYHLSAGFERNAEERQGAKNQCDSECYT